MFLQYDILSDDIGLYSNYNLSYSPSGRIGNKTCDDMLWDYWYGYKKGNNGSLMSHQVRSIYDLYNDNTSFFQWDADGQLLAVVRPCTGDMRHHWWNEAEQMVASIDNASCGYYGYDGNGNRAYKLTGQSAQDQYNAGEWQYHVDFNDAVLYVSPYFIVTPKGYTRHYYNGSMHIASQIGRISDLPTNIIDTSAVARERIANAQAYMASVLGATEELIISTETIADIDGDELDELQWQCLDTNTIAFRITLHSDTNILFPVLNRDAGFPANVLDIYYYHADHLGSASWITNKEGTPIEYIHYMPYGELWYDWQASSYNERFKFTGKERDTETGYDYFGARYYLSLLGIWISPDPLMDKYPHISSYAYCNWNPINRLDPDGRDWVFQEDGSKYMWRDDITENSNMPKGLQYVGTQANDILYHMGLSSQYETQSDWGLSLGAIGGDNIIKGILGVNITNLKATVGISVNCAIDETNVSDNNKTGLTFTGITVNATGVTSSKASSSDLQSDIFGALKVYTNGQTFSGKFAAPKGQYMATSGVIPKSARIIIPASAVTNGNYIQAAKLSLGAPNQNVIFSINPKLQWNLQTRPFFR